MCSHDAAGSIYEGQASARILFGGTAAQFHIMDRRTYRSPTGELAQLAHDRVAGPDGRLWWEVRLTRPSGSVAAVAGQMPIVLYRTRDEARDGYRARLVALRDAGWVRVE